MNHFPLWLRTVLTGKPVVPVLFSYPFLLVLLLLVYQQVCLQVQFLQYTASHIPGFFLVGERILLHLPSVFRGALRACELFCALLPSLGSFSFGFSSWPATWPNHALQQTCALYRSLRWASSDAITFLVRTTILAFFLVLGFGFRAARADPPPADAAQLEQRWQAIQPELFASDAAKKYVGTLVRFHAGVSIQSVMGPLVVITSKEGDTIQVANVSKAARRDIATPHLPLTTVTVEGVITGIDPAKRTVFVKAGKVDVKW